MAGEKVTVESFGVPGSTVTIGITASGVNYWGQATTTVKGAKAIIESFGVPGSKVTVTI